MSVRTYVPVDTKKRAIQFNGENFDEVHEFCHVFHRKRDVDEILYFVMHKFGPQIVLVSDYIVEGTLANEFIVYSPDRFHQEYREVDSEV